MPVSAVVRRSAVRLFHALGAAMLNARSPNLSRERATSISLLVADRSAVLLLLGGRELTMDTELSAPLTGGEYSHRVKLF